VFSEGKNKKERTEFLQNREKEKSGTLVFFYKEKRQQEIPQSASEGGGGGGSKTECDFHVCRGAWEEEGGCVMNSTHFEGEDVLACVLYITIGRKKRRIVLWFSPI